jgi:Xaa-Pro aminopeptidase
MADVSTDLDPAALDGELEQRRNRFAEAMEEEGVDLVLASDTSAWMEYRTGIPRLQGRRLEEEENSANLCAFQPGEVPRFRVLHSNWRLEIETILAERGYPTVDDALDPVDAVRMLVSGEPRRIWVDNDLLFHVAELIRRAFPTAELTSFSRDAWRVRQRKSPYEVARLLAAAEVSERVLFEVAGSLPPRFTRWDLLEECRHRFTAANCPPPAMRSNAYVLLSDGYYEWGRPMELAPSDTIEAPALITIDGGARVDGYYGDIARTLVLGEPPDDWYRSYDVSYEAHRAAVETIAPGARADAAYAAASDVTAREGLSAAHWFPAGHAIGLAIHEPPRLGPWPDDRPDPPVFEAGMTICVEVGLFRRPGIPTPSNVGGMVEDLVLVTDSGAEQLTHAPRTPMPIGGA